MKIAGRCHCGSISFEFDAPGELAARACSCTFCVKHGGVWTSDPKGSLAATVREESIYRFGTGTGDFHVCTRCGAVPFVTSEIDGRVYAVVNVNTFEGLDPKTLPRAPVSFDGESTENRLGRRKQRWIPSVTIRRP
jgi:hypothetical protein